MKVSFLRCFQTAGKLKRDWEVVVGLVLGWTANLAGRVIGRYRHQGDEWK